MLVLPPLLAAGASVGVLLFPASGWTLAISFLGGTVVYGSAISGLSRRSPVGTCLPAGAMALGALVIVFGTVAAPLGAPIWTSRPSALLAWALLLIPGVVSSVLYPARAWLPPVAAVPAALLAGFVALGSAVQPTELWLRHVGTGTDFSRHVLLVHDAATAGNLSYSMGNDSYPRGFHSAIALLLSASGGVTYTTAWRVLEGLTLVLLTLMVWALVLSADAWITRLRVGTAGAVRVVTGSLVVVAAVQGVWPASMLGSGYVTTIVAGFVVSVIAFHWVNDGPALLPVMLVASVLLAHSWPILLPVPVIAALALWASQRTWGGLAQLGLAALFCLPPMWVMARAASSPASREQVAIDVPVALWWPEWWWILGALVALATMAVAARGADKYYRAALVGLMIGSGSSLLISIVLSRSTWADPGYYLLKSLWVLSNWVLPAAISGAILLTLTFYSFARSRERPLARVASTALLTGTVAVLFVAYLGRVSAGERTLPQLRFGFGSVPFTYIVLSDIEQRPTGAERVPALAPWGIAPEGSIESIRFGGAIDRYVAEALEWHFSNVPSLDPGSSTVRDARAMCRFLARHPDALRVTGPNEAPGIGWLRQSGCPSSIVRAREWIRIRMDPSWFQGLEMGVPPYSYPSWREYERVLRGEREEG